MKKTSKSDRRMISDWERKARNDSANKEPESWTRCTDNICRICGKEIEGTIQTYLGQPYHGECMYSGPFKK